MDATSATGRADAPATAASGDGSAAGALPNLIVIGAQKCGTSVLHYYLGLHPEISVSQPKELNFFIEERNWAQGVDWYRGQFDGSATVRAEASPNYSAHPVFEGVPERMHSVVPQAKLIYMLRDPLARIAAHWVHNASKGRVKEDLAETLATSRTYVARSRYAMQLERFLEFYSQDRILIFQQSDLRGNRGETLRRIFEFAGVDPDFTHPRFRQERHKTERKTKLTPLGTRVQGRRDEARHHLVPDRAWAVARDYWPMGRRIERPDVRGALSRETLDLLRKDARHLRELTGRDFSHWSIWDA
jgi:sulfotransferase family protein